MGEHASGASFGGTPLERSRGTRGTGPRYHQFNALFRFVVIYAGHLVWTRRFLGTAVGASRKPTYSKYPLFLEYDVDPLLKKKVFTMETQVFHKIP